MSTPHRLPRAADRFTEPEREREPDRPGFCCGNCPPIVGGGYDCTCEGNPRCVPPVFEVGDLVCIRATGKHGTVTNVWPDGNGGLPYQVETAPDARWNHGPGARWNHSPWGLVLLYRFTTRTPAWKPPTPEPEPAECSHAAWGIAVWQCRQCNTASTTKGWGSALMRALARADEPAVCVHPLSARAYDDQPDCACGASIAHCGQCGQDTTAHEDRPGGRCSDAACEHTGLPVWQRLARAVRDHCPGCTTATDRMGDVLRETPGPGERPVSNLAVALFTLLNPDAATMLATGDPELTSWDNRHRWLATRLLEDDATTLLAALAADGILTENALRGRTWYASKPRPEDTR